MSEEYNKYTNVMNITSKQHFLTLGSTINY